MNFERMSKVYLSRRNLVALLAKLDRNLDPDGEQSVCTIIKHKGTSSEYQQTMKDIMIIAVDDDEYYTAQARPAGEMHPLEEDKLYKPKTGILFEGVGL